ncbi:MAG: PEP-CTERM sorting domain-containing protein [Aquabacterium sp.]|uniref:choice-of-anchor R domain-containing protein n=1 Tax=Aquabacterium sp. TaxID=1872578 RepID=UPI0025C00AA9|nr:choice-of-anchor R domain-containing protein [Aquabacterium sp.]MBI3381080.1 PEP-CTERM sorting domain-containing protein [Aquabacterium sp.]
MHPNLVATHRWAAWALFCTLAWSPQQAALANTLSDNTSQATSGDTVAADASNWVAASFITDAAYGNAALSATVLASGTASATLSLFSSDASGLVPASWLADLTLGSSSASSGSYTLEGISLNASTSYWLVLRNESGNSQWSWTASGDGSGSGFTGIWANSDDAGLSWFTNSTLYPVQMQVSVNGSTASSVPEPASWALTLVALPVLARLRRQHRPA